MIHAFSVPTDTLPTPLTPPSQPDFGINREVAYRQTGPNGELLIVVRFGPGAADATSLRGLGTAPASVRAFTAIPDDLDGDDVYVSALPLLPGMRQKFEEFAKQLDGPRNTELMQQMRTVHHGESVFLQSGDSDLVIPVVIGDRPWRDEHRSAIGEDAFNTWVNAQLATMHNIDFGSEAPPLNELLWDIRA